MLYNTTLNPLGAILNMSYGQLSETRHLISIMNALIDESFEAEKYLVHVESPEIVPNENNSLKW